MSERPFFFGNGDYQLFGVLHAPDHGPVSKQAFVFCHPLAEEKLWTHRVFVSFARRLAARGHAVLRFDYMGNGDSDGDFAQSSLATMTSDVVAAMQTLRAETGSEQVGLIGLRMGATVASLVAEETNVAALVLWSPIVDGSRYMQEILRVNLTTQMAVFKTIRHDRLALAAAMEQGATVNADGYELAFPLYSQVSSVSLASAPKHHERRCLVVQIDRAPSSPNQELEKLVKAYPNATMEMAIEEPFWKEIRRWYAGAPALFETTDRWLGAT